MWCVITIVHWTQQVKIIYENVCGGWISLHNHRSIFVPSVLKWNEWHHCGSLCLLIYSIALQCAKLIHNKWHVNSSTSTRQQSFSDKVTSPTSGRWAQDSYVVDDACSTSNYDQNKLACCQLIPRKLSCQFLISGQRNQVGIEECVIKKVGNNIHLDIFSQSL